MVALTTRSARTQPSHLGVYVAPSIRHGRGVFAAQSFDAGDVVEDCPVLLVATDAVVAIGLDGYCFEWDGERYALALGYGSLYNHSWDPNARYDQDHGASLVSYSALRSIAPGEEITINYRGDPEGRAELWFAPT